MSDYTIAIRTLGTAGEKYAALLKSIEKQSVKPKNVYIVLPEGCSPPEEKLGYEAVIYTERGMISQRINVLPYINTEYTLFCDDDVELAPDFAERLMRPLDEGKADAAAGPLYSFLPHGRAALAAALIGSAMPTVLNKDKYITILKNGGWSYNRHLKSGSLYETDSLAWTCFMIRTRVMRDLKLEEESWLEYKGYAGLDDQTMFYKLKRMGYKTVVVPEAKYSHLDAQTTRSVQREADIEEALARNRIIFWYRLIYKYERNKPLCILAIKYRMLLGRMFGYIRSRSSKEKYIVYEAACRGYKRGMEYIKRERGRECGLK